MKDRNFNFGTGTLQVKFIQCLTLTFDLDLDLGHYQGHLCFTNTSCLIYYSL